MGVLAVISLVRLGTAEAYAQAGSSEADPSNVPSTRFEQPLNAGPRIEIPGTTTALDPTPTASAEPSSTQAPGAALEADRDGGPGASETSELALYGGVARRRHYSLLPPGTIVTLDPSSGEAKPIGTPEPLPDTTFGVTGVAMNSKGELFASVYARADRRSKFSVSATLIQIDPETGGLVETIGGILDAQSRPLKINDLAIQPETDVLFGIGGMSIGPERDAGTTRIAHLYRIDTATAVATLVCDTGHSFGGAIAFSATGELYHCTITGHLDSVTGRKPALMTLNPENGELIRSVPLRDPRNKPHLLVPRGLAVRPGDGTIFLTTNYAHMDDRPVEELHNNLLATIDPETGMVTVLATSVKDVRNRIGDIAFRRVKVQRQP